MLILGSLSRERWQNYMAKAVSLRVCEFLIDMLKRPACIYQPAYGSLIVSKNHSLVFPISLYTQRNANSCILSVTTLTDTYARTNNGVFAEPAGMLVRENNSESSPILLFENNSLSYTLLLGVRS